MEPEHIIHVRLRYNLLMVVTDQGRSLVARIDQLPVQLPERLGPHSIDLDEHGAVLIDGRHLSLARLRLYCEPGYAAAREAEAERMSLTSI